jgi:hypothetical protein
LKSRFESTEWLAAVARLVGSNDVNSAAAALADAIDVAVEHEGTCLLVFHRDAPPEVIHHTLEPAGRRHYVDRYVAGPYLLDPLYLLAVSDQKPGVCRFRDESPDRFRSSEYYRQYCERTHLRDEMDFLVDVSAHSTLVLVVGRRTRRFTKAELGRLTRQVGGAGARHRARHRDGSQAQPVRQAGHYVAIRTLFPVHRCAVAAYRQHGIQLPGRIPQTVNASI